MSAALHARRELKQLFIFYLTDARVPVTGTPLATLSRQSESSQHGQTKSPLSFISAALGDKKSKASKSTKRDLDFLLADDSRSSIRYANGQDSGNEHLFVNRMVDTSTASKGHRSNGLPVFRSNGSANPYQPPASLSLGDSCRHFEDIDEDEDGGFLSSPVCNEHRSVDDYVFDHPSPINGKHYRSFDPLQSSPYGPLSSTPRAKATPASLNGALVN